MKAMVLIACAASATTLLSQPACSEDFSFAPVARKEGWLLKSPGQIDVPAPPDVTDELNKLKAIVAKRTAADVSRFQWWSTGGPVYRWNEIMIDELLDNFITLPLAARHLALFHAALDDAVMVTWHHRKSTARADRLAPDTLIKTTNQSPAGSSFPSDHAAAAAAAAEVLAYIFPPRADTFAARAEEAIQSRLLAGVEYPSDVAAGRAIGRKIAALAIARGHADQSDAKWTGNVPEGPGKWKGANPIAPLAATWRPWVLARADEFRPSPPPAFEFRGDQSGSERIKSVRAVTKIKSSRSLLGGIRGCARPCPLE